MGAPASWLSIFHRLRHPSGQWDIHDWQFACDLRVAAPGIVVVNPNTGLAFDPNAQTVTVQLTIQDNIYKYQTDGQGSIVPINTPTPIPPLYDVPVVIPRAGGYSLTLPITAGDECLVIFNDNCINSWWQNGGVGNVREERRRHDLSDAIAIFGVWSQPRTLPSYSIQSAQLRSDDGTMIIDLNLGAGLITITAPTVQINGNLNVTGLTDLQGNAIISGDPTINGRDWMNHKHTGVTTGGGQTGGVV